MDVKKICWGLCLLTCFGGFAGCSDDEEGFNENVIIRDDFTNTEGERIDFVLDDVPACIIWRNDSNVTFCYAQYAYEYYFDREYLLEMSDDEFRKIDLNVMNKRFAVSLDDFNEFGLDLSIGTKVYVSAEITNIGRISDTEDWLQVEGTVPICRKAYLTGLKVRE